MLFLNRERETARLEAALGQDAFVVVYGRRRIGKTRLLMEWSAPVAGQPRKGVYFLADESSAELQRSHLALALSEQLPGFADVSYPTWQTLLARLAQAARHERFRGPLVLDEFPYLVTAAKELPSVLQAFVDGPAKQINLVLCIAGSNQRMMADVALNASAPLFGRATDIIHLGPLPPAYLRLARRKAKPTALEMLSAFTAWGGIPRYWELAFRSSESEDEETRIDHLVLDPMGTLHEEGLRLLQEEGAPMTEARPLLEAIGGGAHRLSEIAGRLGKPTTSLGRGLELLQSMQLVERETPFGVSERDSKRSLYRIADPFLRLWFRVVAPRRGYLRVSDMQARKVLLRSAWPGLTGQAWEQMCRENLHRLAAARLGMLESQPQVFAGAKRWWQGSAAEWDLVSESQDGYLLLGECKAPLHEAAEKDLLKYVREAALKPLPPFAATWSPDKLRRALFIPALAKKVPRTIEGWHVVTLDDLTPMPGI
jgi:uncharacterized protein